MPETRQAIVVAKGGITGVLLDPVPASPSRHQTVRVRFACGSVVPVPADSLVQGSDGTFLVPFGPSDVAPESPSAASADREEVIPVIAEELVIDKNPVQTGGVRVTRRVVEHHEMVQLPLLKEHVDVRRVVIDREVEGPLHPA